MYDKPPIQPSSIHPHVSPKSLKARPRAHIRSPFSKVHHTTMDYLKLIFILSWIGISLVENKQL